MSTLCFELTRRCNMNCDFCCRGDAQKVDITKKIIKKNIIRSKWSWYKLYSYNWWRAILK